MQFSSWSWFLGVDVALIGAIGYALIVLTAAVGSAEARADARGPALALAALVYPAILFTLRLKYAEFFVMKTFCPWCAISAVSITHPRRARRTRAPAHPRSPPQTQAYSGGRTS